MAPVEDKKNTSPNDIQQLKTISEQSTLSIPGLPSDDGDTTYKYAELDELNSKSLHAIALEWIGNDRKTRDCEEQEGKRKKVRGARFQITPTDSETFYRKFVTPSSPPLHRDTDVHLFIGTTAVCGRHNLLAVLSILHQKPFTQGATCCATRYTTRSSVQVSKLTLRGCKPAVHSAVMQADGTRAAGLAVRREPIETVHPHFRVHPVAGWKSVFVNPGLTRHIVSVPKAESDAILFQQIATNPYYQLQPNDDIFF
ncbi:hypothetical protein E1B28_011893 [Marasmius oreades]|uniref:Uncharacterized protein n=1 Tax=Marasmius oreades TaxID=181124 RepID=A0A9P7RV10_9AGAR|nr:uncharacterized protein E1B28_011893 [Marasmius oreades]KAG7090296.1 hypothetical protein E1B28_011893 [Marasmius oreades]